MAVPENGWLEILFDPILGRHKTRKARQELRARMRQGGARPDAMRCEQLEGRVVLSNAGGGFGGGVAGASTLLQDLNNLGVGTSPIPASPTATPASMNTSIAQLLADQAALQAELQSLAAKSGVTVADLTQLELDSQTIGQDWHEVDLFQLKQQAVSDLTTASALPGAMSPTPTAATTTTSTTSPLDEFVALFPTADQTSGAAAAVYNDLVKIVTNSQVTTTDLNTVAPDQAAIQSGLSNLSAWGQFGFGGGGYGGGGGGPGGGILGTIVSDISGLVTDLGGSGGDGLGSVISGPIVVGGAGGPSDAVTAELNNLGVITSPIIAGTSTLPTSSNTLVAQLQMDQQTLQSELQTLSTGSGVTVAQLTQLSTDSQTLGMAWRGISPSMLDKALTDLATANAADVINTSTPTAAQMAAKSEFLALFSMANQPAATAVYNDLVAIIVGSGVKTTDLTTVATDQAAVQADLTALENGGKSGGGGDNGGGQGGSSGGGEHGGSAAGNMLTSILNQLGVITTPPATSTATPPTSSNPLVTQLQTDEQAASNRARYRCAAPASAVTVSDVTKLITDTQSLGTALNGVSSSDLTKRGSATWPPPTPPTLRAPRPRRLREKSRIPGAVPDRRPDGGDGRVLPTWSLIIQHSMVYAERSPRPLPRMRRPSRSDSEQPAQRLGNA